MADEMLTFADCLKYDSVVDAMKTLRQCAAAMGREFNIAETDTSLVISIAESGHHHDGNAGGHDHYDGSGSGGDARGGHADARGSASGGDSHARGSASGGYAPYNSWSQPRVVDGYGCRRLCETCGEGIGRFQRACYHCWGVTCYACDRAILLSDSNTWCSLCNCQVHPIHCLFGDISSGPNEDVNQAVCRCCIYKVNAAVLYEVLVAARTGRSPTIDGKIRFLGLPGP